MPGDVLSQSEIDALLAAVAGGDVDADAMKNDAGGKKVKVYDFKRPDKFSKDQIRTLYMLHESFARLLNTYLSTHLRTLVNVDVASVEQLTYQEFVQSMANPSVISVLGVPPLKGNFVPAPPLKKQPIKIITPRNYFEPIKNEVYERGYKYFTEKNYPQAAACFEESIHDKNYFEKSLKYLMSIYKVDYGENLDAQIEKGLQLLNQYENLLEPNTVINERIQLLDKAKRRDELIEELQKAIENSSKINQKLHYRFQLAREYSIKGDYSAAITNYEEWIKEKNSNRYKLSPQINLIEITAKQNIAICLYLSGEKARAKEIAQKILPFTNNNQTLQDILNDELRVDFDSEELSGKIFQDDSPLSPYAQYILSIIPLEKTYSTTYHRLFKNKFDQKFIGDDFIGTPEEAARIKKDIINSLGNASDRERSEAWDF